MPVYLQIAAVVSILSPLLELAWLHYHAPPCTTTLYISLMLPYYLVFIPQILLETRLLRSSCVATTIPFCFAYYRMWQMLRFLLLHCPAYKAFSSNAAHEACTQVQGYTLFLLCFWVFDTSVLMTWMPSMANCQLVPPVGRKKGREAGDG